MSNIDSPVVVSYKWKCQECEAITDDHVGPLYECGSCGQVFTRDSSANNNHQCPSCNKFGSKIADHACGDCNEGEVQEVEGVVCVCHDEFHVVNEI